MQKIESRTDKGRQRKVKCDQQRPVCKRCSSTDRHCAGYGIWGGGSATVNATSTVKSTKESLKTALTPCMTIAASPGLQIVSPAERDSYDWFLCRSAIKLPGLNRPTFWKSTLLQASVIERPVLHAVLALSAIHRQGALVADGTGLATTLNTFVLEQYGQAIRSLCEISPTKTNSALNITSVACIIFVCIEFLRGHYQSGLKHLDFAMKLLHEVTSFFDSPTDTSILFNHEIINPILRLYIQTSFLTPPTSPIPSTLLTAALSPLPAIFPTLSSARFHLDLILASLLHHQHHPPPDPQHISTLHLLQLQTFLTAYSATMASLYPTTTPRIDFIYLSALNTHRLATLMATALPSQTFSHQDPHTEPSPTSEAIFDAQISTFASLLKHALSQYHATHTPALRAAIVGPYFTEHHARNEATLDVGWLYYLFYVAVKCHVGRLRRQAVGLMGTTSHKEGCWDAEIVRGVAEEVVRLEEEEVEGSGDDGERWDGGLLEEPVEGLGGWEEEAVPLERRLRGLRIVLPEGKDGALEICYWRGQGVGRREGRRWDLRTKVWSDILDFSRRGSIDFASGEYVGPPVRKASRRSLAKTFS